MSARGPRPEDLVRAPALRTATRTRRLAAGLIPLVALVVGLTRPTHLDAQPALPPSDSAALALLDRVATAYRGARTLRARFTQTLTPASGGRALTSRGEFLQAGAARFAFRFTDPADDRIVADGAAVWIYLPSTLRGQAIRLPRGVGAGAGLDLVASLLTDPARRYVVRALPDTTLAGRREAQVTLEPRAGGAPFSRATLRIDPARRIIVAATLREPSGLVRALTFSEVRLGARLPADAFIFTPPPGVRVIDQAALLGGVPPR
ncbi:MAG: outer membrane lipoprotein carrier protein LolA [Gemmatimonadota bacterium]|nr:outer membrane lipoprotein carrier protein LolA [Gemmatimonadota bacterium]MDQ8147248.1 outer membrane lipoprotein carrier protein LolA [Gemmatimonadota bacterium]MDQ8149232.1 outer membrane lipoprotein carrier protein LolA [Gemmatimonadota bacterium]MDQ8157053.1 outer membrane lipoprotein carrier protein LolA [Gemmatimonadota bacterium]MDQ8176714.1 outer membrane lipoprotein carrier protein LolA [Gemmatimonadota bacterium]